MATASESSTFKCSICLDIFDKPVDIGCGHIYCSKCVSSLPSSPPQCPQCREVFDIRRMSPAVDIEIQLHSTKSNCQWCGKDMLMTQLRNHNTKCSMVDRSIPKFKPIKMTSQEIPSHLPNRSTFDCPYCKKGNLDNSDLVKHCNKHHKHDPSNVICPICVAMPWGESDRRSANFIQHLNLRHKFEYETYVDFIQDDDAMLEAALQASLND
ncbi:E3 ubiquitin-protein ligase RNF166-like isoform X3 [Gigantopelta aegis]|uniref:E3 ubiquitin-protein ligase RNF166-like isoform X3 n=1 Tax=Gigantopelta aegis TaxID=1735272 RepID=UPI001B88AFBE|nr:E3 ubiquitin-protein ligase RNF166-like isoform X3 [Gigantopelta aegis]